MAKKPPLVPAERVLSGFRTPEEADADAVLTAKSFTVTCFAGRGTRETEYDVPTLEEAKKIGREKANRMGRGSLIYAIKANNASRHVASVDPDGYKEVPIRRKKERS